MACGVSPNAIRLETCVETEVSFMSLRFDPVREMDRLVDGADAAGRALCGTPPIWVTGSTQRR